MDIDWKLFLVMAAGIKPLLMSAATGDVFRFAGNVVGLLMMYLVLVLISRIVTKVFRGLKRLIFKRSE